ETRIGVGLPRPGIYLEPWHQNRTLVEREAFIHHGGQVNIRHAAGAITMRAHTAGAFKLGDGLLAVIDAHRALRAYRWHIKRIRTWSTHVRFCDTREEHAQHAGDIGDGAERWARIRSQRLLADDDRRGKALEVLHIRTCERLHETLHEAWVGFID